MRLARDPAGVLVQPFAPGQRASCPQCGGPVVALLPKEGEAAELYAPRWRHVIDDCDPLDDRPETRWRVGWQDVFEARGHQLQEVLGGHRFDVRLMDAPVVVRIQPTILPSHEIEAIEAVPEPHGLGLRWLLHAEHWFPSALWPCGSECRVMLVPTPKFRFSFRAPVYVDFGGWWTLGLSQEKRFFRVLEAPDVMTLIGEWVPVGEVG